MDPRYEATGIWERLQGGIEKAVMVPMAISQVERIFCFPAVLVQNWAKVRM